MTHKPKALPQVNLGEDIDPALFEYDPADPPDSEVFEMMAMREVSPDVIVDPREREKYIQFLRTYQAKD